MRLKDYEDGKTRCFFNLATDETYIKQTADGTGFYCIHNAYVTGPVKINHVSTNYSNLYFH